MIEGKVLRLIAVSLSQVKKTRGDPQQLCQSCARVRGGGNQKSTFLSLYIAKFENILIGTSRICDYTYDCYLPK